MKQSIIVRYDVTNIRSPYRSLAVSSQKSIGGGAGNRTQHSPRFQSVQPMQASRLSVTICLLPITDLSSLKIHLKHSHAPVDTNIITINF